MGSNKIRANYRARKNKQYNEPTQQSKRQKLQNSFAKNDRSKGRKVQKQTVSNRVKVNTDRLPYDDKNLS